MDRTAKYILCSLAAGFVALVIYMASVGPAKEKECSGYRIVGVGGIENALCVDNNLTYGKNQDRSGSKTLD